MNLEDFARKIPKAELHIHIEGSLEPELMFALAAKNEIALRFDSVEQVREAYAFSDLQSFLDIYYEGAKVLRTEQDFFDLTWAYLQRAHGDTVRHSEVFFDPQTHTERGVAFGTVVSGIARALAQGRAELGITSKLIMCFLRHLSEQDAFECLEQALPFKSQIAAVGLDSSERGNPPEKFARVFERARAQGFLAVAHAGEEGPPSYIIEALDLLKVARIDHGVRCSDDAAVMDRLACEQVPLTVCPLSNVKLRVFDKIEEHNLAKLLAAGLQVSVHSDDPAYFGGYLNDNLLAVVRGLDLTRDDVVSLAKNSIEASFLDVEERRALMAELDAYVHAH